jgi:glycosyltransferase involved in cell wall biosynthesis
VKARSITDLPAPPPGRAGWPWTSDSEAPASICHSAPPVTIVTPSFNQAEFIEATLRSVLLQDYPNLEYIVVDGGSTDGTLEVLYKYAPLLDHWVSEPDRGQAHAINKGLMRASGEIVAWLNSDDYYTPGAVARAVAHYIAEADLDWLYGDCLLVHHPEGTLEPCPSRSFDFASALDGDCPISQPSVFLRRSLLDRIGLLDESFAYAMDYDLWLRASKVARPTYVAGAPVAVINDHDLTKSRSRRGEVVFESTRAVERFFDAGGAPVAALAVKRQALGRLYFECAAASVLSRKSLVSAVPWYLRSIAYDARNLRMAPSIAWQSAMWLVSGRPAATR